MPWTFAHPAAVLPLRRLCPAWLSFPALAAGTLAPDFGYYVGAMPLGSFAHTSRGSVLAALPIGMSLLALFYLMRRPLWYLLPQPHRMLLASRSLGPIPVSLWQWLGAAASVLLGAWTHLAWDSFTHAHGFGVVHLPLLHQLAFDVGGVSMPLYALLQHASTVLGTAALVAAYRSWLVRNGESRLLTFHGRDLWRYGLLGALALSACALAVLWAAEAAARAAPAYAAQVFVFRAAVYGAALLAALLLAVAPVCYACRPVRAPSPN